jgi:TP901 family phage tail tape measure protein
MNDTTVIDIVAQVTDETGAGAASATATVSKLEKAMQKAQAGISKLKKMSKIEITMYAIDKASKVLNGVATVGKKLAGKVWSVTLKAVDLVTAPFRGIMRMIANPIVAMAGIAGIGFGVGDLINTYKDFEQGMANVKAIMRGTDAEMLMLTETAKKLGAETTFSAKQVSEAMEFLAMAGWKAKDIASGMPGLLDLAAAGAVDVATAADVVSSALAQFNMEAKESTRVADVLAATATNSKTDVTGLGESLKYAGSQAGALGYVIEDVALAFGLMGNKGIDASSAGTSLRTTLARMAKQGELTGDETEAVAVAMNDLGVSLTDNAGKTKPLIQLMRDLRKGFANLSETEKAATAATLAGVNAQSGLLAIVNTSEDKFNLLADAIAASAGAANEMAKTRMDTLVGAFEELSGAVETTKIEFMERLAPYLRGFVDWLTSKMPGVRSAALGLADDIGKATDKIMDSVSTMTQSPEWQNAETLWDKIKVAWDRLIAEPFDKWWNTKGKAWMAAKARNIGSGIGSAIKYGTSALFGIDARGALDDGANIGASFAKGFSDGIEDIDWDGVAKGISGALLGALKLVFSNPVTGALATAWIGGKVLGGISGIYNAKNIFGTIKGAGAAAAGAGAGIPVLGSSGQILGMAGGSLTAGLAKVGVGLGSGASTVGGAALAGGAAGAGGLIAAIGLVDAGTDFVRGLNAADKREGDAYKKSAGWKAGGIAAGAATGAMIGSVVPIIGTAVGALMGAGLGYLGGKVFGDNEIEKYAKETQAAEESSRRLKIKQEQALYSSKKLKSAVQDLADGYITADQFMAMKQAEITSNLQKRFGNIELSVNDIMRLSEKITFGGMKAGMTAFAEASGRADNALSQMEGTISELERMNWKAKNGLAYDAEEYKAGADAFRAGAKEYIESRQYEISAATKLLIGDDADTASLNAVFAGIQSNIEALGTELTAKFTAEGELDVDSITDIQNQITEQMNKLSGAEYEGNLDLLKIQFGGDNLSLESFEKLQTELEKNAQAARESITNAYGAAFAGLELELAEGLFGTEGRNSEKYKGRFSELEDAYKREMAGVDQRITDFLLEEIGDKFDISASDLTKGMQDSLTSGIQPGNWTAEQAASFLGIPSLETQGAIELAGVAGRLAAAFPSVFGKMAPIEGLTWAEGAVRDTTLKPHAAGGIFGSAHVGLVAEDGAEAIIPLSGKRRDRGLDLWQKAGQMLGVMPHAAGGIFGVPRSATPILSDAASGGGIGGATVTVPVTIDNVTLAVSIDRDAATDTESIVAVLKANIQNLTDEIAHSIAISLEQVFANLPKAATEA